MKRTPSVLQKTMAAAVASLALWAPSAQAGLVTFEDVDTAFYGVGDTFTSGNMAFTSVDTEGVAPLGSLSGALFDSTDSGSCTFDCPVNNGGKYYAGLADGALLAQASTNGARFMLKGFDASFIGLFPGSTYPSTPGYLRVMGFIGNSYATETYALDPIGPNGFELARFNTSAGFGALAFDSLAFFAFGCANDSAASCSAVGTYTGQFGLDNLETADVPEPASMMTMLLGLAGMGAALRRRRSK